MAPVFEALSRVYTSNDGKLSVERYSRNDWVVFRPNRRTVEDIVLHSKSREICEAFILGYDEGRSLGS